MCGIAGCLDLRGAGRIERSVAAAFGFRAPGSPLLLERRIPWVEDLLSVERIRRQGFFDAGLVERLKARSAQPGFRLHPHLETDLLMIVLTFNLFLEIFEVPDPS